MKRLMLFLVSFLTILAIFAFFGCNDSPIGINQESEKNAETIIPKDSLIGPQLLQKKDPMKWPQSVSDFSWPFGLFDLAHFPSGVVFQTWKIINGYHSGKHVNTWYPSAGKYSVDLVRADVRKWTKGSWVLAPARGVVVFSGWMNGYGWCVVMDHDYGHTGKGFKSIEAHLDGDPRSYVNVGDDLRAGTFLGYCGSSGGDYTPHIHFSIWQHNKSVMLTGISGYYNIVLYKPYLSLLSYVRSPANPPR
ncbi:MAG: M23 family metallopeptidase [Patescibacteria group bacterium]